MKESLASFISGGTAGLAIEVVFYPLDTLTTRIQSPLGLMASGGFRNLYKGIGSVTLISFPYSAVFLSSYEILKRLCDSYKLNKTSSHILAASFGEIAGNLVRVPAEVVKQRAQATNGFKSYSAFLFTIRGEGLRGLYRGFKLAVAQDIPFSIIQFVLWEKLKFKCYQLKGRPASPFESGIAGAIGGTIASFVTTPIDVARTRVVLASANSSLVRLSIWGVVVKIGQDDGIKALFSGGFLRVMAFSSGSMAFFFAYEKMQNFFFKLINPDIA